MGAPVSGFGAGVSRERDHVVGIGHALRFHEHAVRLLVEVALMELEGLQ